MVKNSTVYSTLKNLIIYTTLIFDCHTCAGHQAVSEQQVFHGGRPIERSGVSIIDGEGQSVGDVIVKIFADSRKIANDRHTYRIELLSRSYAAI